MYRTFLNVTSAGHPSAPRGFCPLNFSCFVCSCTCSGCDVIMSSRCGSRPDPCRRLAVPWVMGSLWIMMICKHGNVAQLNPADPLLTGSPESAWRPSNNDEENDNDDLIWIKEWISSEIPTAICAIEKAWPCQGKRIWPKCGGSWSIQVKPPANHKSLATPPHPLKCFANLTVVREKRQVSGKSQGAISSKALDHSAIRVGLIWL